MLQRWTIQNVTHIITSILMLSRVCIIIHFLFNDSTTTQFYTLSLHDALPISSDRLPGFASPECLQAGAKTDKHRQRSEEHTSELQSRQYLVCRLLLEKKKALAGTANCELRWGRSRRISVTRSRWAGGYGRRVR